MNRKFTARQVLQQGHQVDTFVLCVGGVKFGELHGLGKGGYAFFFNDKTRLVPWLESDADDFTWTDLKGAMENAKRLWERREVASTNRKNTSNPDPNPDALKVPKGRREGWVDEFVNGR